MAGKPPEEPTSNRRIKDAAFGRWFTASAEAAGYVGRGWKRQLASDAGVNETGIGRYADGETLPSSETCGVLAKLLNVDPDEMRVKAGRLTPAEAAERKGMAPSARRYDTPTQRRINNWLDRHSADDPQRRRIEQLMSQIIDIAESPDKSNGTAG